MKTSAAFQPVLVVLAVIACAVPGPAACTGAQTNVAPASVILLRIPEFQPATNTLPPDDFILTVSRAAAYSRSAGRALPFLLIGKSPSGTDAAKIILHSFGIANRNVTGLPSVPAELPGRPERLAIGGDFSPLEKDALRKQARLTMPIPEPASNAAPTAGDSTVSTVVVVLGNEPLDESTPTIDTVRRVEKAVEILRRTPGSVMLATGGKATGCFSEASMMALIAISRGVSGQRILREEHARSTEENASLSAELVAGLNPSRIVIVSKQSHLDWAMPIFREVPLFRSAESAAADVSNTEIASHMREYLRYKKRQRVFDRLRWLVQDVHGVD